MTADLYAQWISIGVNAVHKAAGSAIGVNPVAQGVNAVAQLLSALAQQHRRTRQAVTPKAAVSCSSALVFSDCLVTCMQSGSP